MRRQHSRCAGAELSAQQGNTDHLETRPPEAPHAETAPRVSSRIRRGRRAAKPAQLGNSAPPVTQCVPANVQPGHTPPRALRAWIAQPASTKQLQRKVHAIRAARLASIRKQRPPNVKTARVVNTAQTVARAVTAHVATAQLANIAAMARLTRATTVLRADTQLLEPPLRHQRRVPNAQ